MAGVNRPDINEIRALKVRGHDAIDRLVKLGTPKALTYKLLATKLGCSEEWAHFQMRFTKRDVLKLVEAAESLERERRTYLKQQQAEKRAEATRRAQEPIVPPVPVVIPSPSRWTRIKAIVKGILYRRA